MACEGVKWESARDIQSFLLKSKWFKLIIPCNSTIFPFCFPFSYARAILHSVGLSTEIGKKCLLWNKRLPQFSSPKIVLLATPSITCQVFSTDMSVLRPLLAQWEKVAVFFMLRLTVAACVESMLLLDRAMYLQEQGVEWWSHALLPKIVGLTLSIRG